MIIFAAFPEALEVCPSVLEVGWAGTHCQLLAGTPAHGAQGPAQMDRSVGATYTGVQLRALSAASDAAALGCWLWPLCSFIQHQGAEGKLLKAVDLPSRIISQPLLPLPDLLTGVSGEAEPPNSHPTYLPALSIQGPTALGVPSGPSQCWCS